VLGLSVQAESERVLTRCEYDAPLVIEDLCGSPYLLQSLPYPSQFRLLRQWRGLNHEPTVRACARPSATWAAEFFSKQLRQTLRERGNSICQPAWGSFQTWIFTAGGPFSLARPEELGRAIAMGALGAGATGEEIRETFMGGTSSRSDRVGIPATADPACVMRL
jgi:hypothetical protein